MYNTLQPVLEKELEAIKEAGLYKQDRVIVTPQGADIKVSTGQEVVNVLTIIWDFLHIQK